MYMRMREFNMVFPFGLLCLISGFNCIILYWLSIYCGIILKKVLKKFRGILADIEKVCTFATAFERETR